MKREHRERVVVSLLSGRYKTTGEVVDSVLFTEFGDAAWRGKYKILRRRCDIEIDGCRCVKIAGHTGRCNPDHWTEYPCTGQRVLG